MNYVLRVFQEPSSRPKSFDISTMELEKTNWYLLNNCIILKKQLASFLDRNGLMRVRGRLENSGLSYDEMHPVIVPEKSYFAGLLINHTHQLLCHAEYKDVQAVYHVQTKISTSNDGSLPPERATFSLPFTYTGVDFAGPFNLKTSSLRNAKVVKGYAAVFVCFSTKAVHLEVCSDLSSDAFLAAFTRFTGRRGLPKTMFSDNGKNFGGASYKLLQAHNTFLMRKSVSSESLSHG
ncbi:uncharacterized protein LOC142224665 [Haematobia irritans]|uniref:uncharacterized protein LOC142224665 n=1 Tax=Haematobia irritans TaxID=7368 RepID=UPI003F50BB50